LESIGVEVLLNTMVTDVNEKGVGLKDRFIPTKNIIWAAGNTISPLLKHLNTELDKAGRAIVNADLSLKDDPDIFIIGDAALIKDKSGKFLPGIAPVAMQQGRYVAKIIK